MLVCVGCDLAIIVPVFNEGENVGPLAAEICGALANQTRSFEIVFIDDGSTDATWSKIQEVSGVNARVLGLRHRVNSGQSAALWTGFQATESPLIATLDGDLQNDPADLPVLLSEIEWSDFACGVRTKRHDSRIRLISSKVARNARRYVLGVDFADTGCALRVFKRSVLRGVFPFDGMHRFLPILVHAAGFVVREVPIRHRPRVAGASKYGVTLPKRLRIYFRFERRLLGELCRSAWEVVRTVFQSVSGRHEGVPGMIGAIQT